MDYRKLFLAKPGKKIKLADIDPGYHGKHITEAQAKVETEKYCATISSLQDLMYSEGHHSLLIVLQAMDAGGKDGTVRHAMSTMNPIGTIVTSFKQPTTEDLKHDFLWRVHPHAPDRGQVAIFNRSHYEDVLVVRVHNLVPKRIWSKRYRSINEFEKLLWHENNTRILKFFLYISPEEQLERFKERLDDPARNWKISEDDYREREFWDDYIRAYEAVFRQTSTDYAPWYVIPANHKWFRNFAIAQIVAATFQEMNIQTPKPQVDLELIRRQYHQAEEQEAEPQTPSNNQSRSTKPKK
ncbi:MAG TPA: polyphosphate kinase 2 family protein [Verrucomicrobiae bacterium]|jgi:PPK2 family polyphosphate:nucleotide phosphotransferase|nr:polyphosphate kinase 2 family protein [Verrucomicrobiae bacterium]